MPKLRKGRKEGFEPGLQLIVSPAFYRCCRSPNQRRHFLVFGRRRRLTVSHNVVELHCSVVDIPDLCHHAVDMESVDKHPRKQTHAEVV